MVRSVKFTRHRDGQRRPPAWLSLHEHERGVAVAHVETGADGWVAAFGLDEGIDFGDGAVLGQTPLRAPPADLQACSQRRVESGAVYARLARLRRRAGARYTSVGGGAGSEAGKVSLSVSSRASFSGAASASPTKARRACVLWAQTA